MSKGLEVLDMLTENSPAQSDDESVTIQAVKVKKEKIDRRRKGNHERTEAQKKAFEAVKAKRDAIRKERIEKRTAEEQQLKEELPSAWIAHWAHGQSHKQMARPPQPLLMPHHWLAPVEARPNELRVRHYPRPVKQLKVGPPIYWLSYAMHKSHLQNCPRLQN